MLMLRYKQLSYQLTQNVSNLEMDNPFVIYDLSMQWT